MEGSGVIEADFREPGLAVCWCEFPTGDSALSSWEQIRTELAKLLIKRQYCFYIEMLSNKKFKIAINQG